MARGDQHSYKGDQRESRERPTIEAKVDSRASTGHPDRNEDAALGDVIRLREEADNPPKMETRDSTADAEAVRLARERELSVAEQLKDKKVFGVLDGISGGKEGGGTGVVASRLASARISERMAAMPAGLTVEQTKQHLLQAMQEADQDVKSYRDAADAATQDSARKKELKQMGTTADVVAFVDNPDGSQEAVIGHVGDSRVYLFDEKTKKLQSLTADENVVGYMLRIGQISRAEYDQVMATDDVDSLPDKLKTLGQNFGMSVRQAKNTLFNALGTGGVKAENVFSVKVEPGQKLMITSDGIHDNLTDAELERLLAEGKTMEDITRLASESGRKPDDVSGALIEIKGATPDARAERPAAQSAEDQMRTWEKAVGDARTEIARLEALKAAGAGAPRNKEGRADVMLNMDGRAVMELAKLGGPAAVDRRIRDLKIDSLANEYQVAQADLADAQKDAGMSAQQAREQLRVQQNIIDWQRNIQEAARASMPGRMGRVMNVDRNAIDDVTMRVERGEDPREIMQEASQIEKNALMKAERLSSLDKMASRLEEIANEYHRLDGEKRSEAAAAEQARQAAEQAQIQETRRSLESSPAPSARQEAPPQQPRQQPQKKSAWSKVKGFFGFK